MSELREHKKSAVDIVRSKRSDLVAVSHAIHEKPELGFEEHFAHDLLCNALERADLQVERGAYGLDSAFRACAGQGDPRIAILCEYDALPGLGHACGHNVIAAAGIGAGIALAKLCEEMEGQVVVLGTPAEEALGGKIIMIDRGAFDDVSAAMMVHPASVDAPSLPSLASQRLEVTFHGRSAHAAANPEQGRNALDAAILGYLGAAALRQHIGDNERLHGIFRPGNDRANIVPERAAMEWFARSEDSDSLGALRPRLLTALEAGAQAAGCRMEYHCDPMYAELRTSATMAACYGANAAVLGRQLLPPKDALAAVGRGSTDMGNVSQIVPSIHPLVRIAPGIGLHTKEFERCAASVEADNAIVDAAAAMAMTALDLWDDPSLIEGPKLDEMGSSA